MLKDNIRVPVFRIREREAEFQKQVIERDDQIGRLKERLHILSSKVGRLKERLHILSSKVGRLKERLHVHILSL